MKKVLLILLILTSCKTQKNIVSTESYNQLDKFGNIKLIVGTEQYNGNDFSGFMTIDRKLNKTKLLLGLLEFNKLIGTENKYHYFNLELIMDTAHHRPQLTTYILDSSKVIIYQALGDNYFIPFYPQRNALVRLTGYDSIDAHFYRISGDFNFYAAKKRIIKTEGMNNLEKVKSEYFDTILISGSFDSVHFNFIYSDLEYDFGDENDSINDTLNVLK